jgi:retron-type reverse transcriptase
VRDYNADYNNRRNVNANYRQDNGYEMVFFALRIMFGDCMETYRTLYQHVCNYQNLESAFDKASNRKSNKWYVIKFGRELQVNLEQLKHKLEDFTYSPKPLTTFIVRDPKTREINSSDFRDRVVYHALCNIIAPIFEKNFIHDSFANQKSKGTHNAIKRAVKFMGKIKLQRATGGGGANDIRHYFDTVDHEILLNILERKIKDPNTIWLIKLILSNHKSEVCRKGMPLGNLTSQFFANVYLNELDQYIKHKMRVKYYIRYVDDFVIFHRDKLLLKKWMAEIDEFLKQNLKIEMHPEKSRIIKIDKGITMLGFRIFPDNILIKKSNSKRIWKRLKILDLQHHQGKISTDELIARIEGWSAYAKFGNTYHLRKKIYLSAKSIFLDSYFQKADNHSVFYDERPQSALISRITVDTSL